VFPYTGLTAVTATAATASTDRITVSDSTGFELNDSVIFTGTIFASEITLGQVYYIKSIPTTTTVTLSATPNGTTLNILTNSSGSMTMAKPGSFAYLPEPFYFQPSIVRYNNRLYECLVSNDDSEFIFGKWQLVDSGSRDINAMDRAIGYYQPTANMPGLDLTQLFEGVTYPNPIYYGNAFEPSKQFEIDTNLQDQPFYPNDVQIKSVVYNEGEYYAAANLPNYSSVVYSENTEDWAISRLSNVNIGVTDISYYNGTYIMTSTNSATPIFRSTNGIEWTTNGYFTPWGEQGWSEYNYDMTALSVAALALHSVTGFNNFWYAVGDSIVASNDTYVWGRVHSYTPSNQVTLYGIATASISDFAGLVAVGSGLRLDYASGTTQLVPTNVISTSRDGLVWQDIASLTDKTFYAVAANTSTITIVGESGVIYYSTDGELFLGLNEAIVNKVNDANDRLSLTNTDGFTVGDAIRFTASFSTIVAGTTYYVKDIINSRRLTISDTSGGSTKALTPYNVKSQILVYKYELNPKTLYDVIYANGIWVAVGESGTIQTSTTGLDWTTRTSGTTNNLNGITWTGTEFTVVGDNNTVITSSDGISWSGTPIFNVLPPVYDVKGADFPYGYAPEELVAGNVRDSVALTVTTRPGTNWDAPEYANVGYNVVSSELVPTSATQTVYSFDRVVLVPAQVAVQILDASTMLGTTLSPTEYTVDWVNKTVILDTPLSFTPSLDVLRIDVYEVGNGDQLVKSSTHNDPIRTNLTTGFNEIYLNCNYSASMSNGSGVIQPSSFDIVVTALSTSSITNKITCEDVSKFSIGQAVTFTGVLFGNIQANTTYYIKSVSIITETITVSLSYDPLSGIAGPTATLTDGTGTMYVNLAYGSDVPWSTPYVMHNGTVLLQGYSSQVTGTSASTNTVFTNSTAGMTIDMPVTFSNTIFGNVIQPMTRYYVTGIVDSNNFTISTTPGGTNLTLTTASGGAYYVTNDFAFGLQPNNIQATLIFATDSYNNSNDYLCYSVFGQGSPITYGYTIPQREEFEADGTSASFVLSNFVGGDNPDNAIVEIDGIRQDSSEYNIDFGTNSVTFVVVPTAGSIVAVTSYNITDRQYLNTQYGILGSVGLVAEITNISNNITSPLANTLATATASGTNRITVTSTTGFIVGATVEFRGTAFGNIATDGTVYFVNAVVDGTRFTIKDADGNVITLSSGTGSMGVIVGGQPAVRVSTSIQTGFTTNTFVRIDGVEGSTQLNNNTYYVRVIDNYTFDLYTEPFTATLNGVNYPVINVSNYISGGFVWEQGSFYLVNTSATATIAANGHINVASDAGLIYGTPVYFTQSGSQNGDNLMGGLIQGTEYYIRDFITAGVITVSSTRGGPVTTLTSDTGNINVTQWKQTNVDRLWVTVNGYRVPSSKLRLNDVNEVSILTAINPGDVVIITSMMPSATPDQEIYLNLIDYAGNPAVYSANDESRTWLTRTLGILDTVMYVDDVTSLTQQVVQNVSAPVAVDGYYIIGLSVDKRILTGVSVYNNTTGQYVSNSYINIILVDSSPTIKIASGSWITAGDSLTITSLEGNTVYINGEQIKFTTLNPIITATSVKLGQKYTIVTIGTTDFTAIGAPSNTIGVTFTATATGLGSGTVTALNAISGIQRGANGTGAQIVIPQYTDVIGLLDFNRMNDIDYYTVWNSYFYNPVNGDPLQISQTAPAAFLNK
jgi:hypothetical protein